MMKSESDVTNDIVGLQQQQQQQQHHQDHKSSSNANLKSNFYTTSSSQPPSSSFMSSSSSRTTRTTGNSTSTNLPPSSFEIDVESVGGLNTNLGKLLMDNSERNVTKKNIYVWLYALIVFCTTLGLSLGMRQMGNSDIDMGLIFGSIQTILCCGVLLTSYHGIHTYRRHPNHLIYYRCIMDTCLALRFLSDPLFAKYGVYIPGDPTSCKWLSGLTEFLFIGADSWFFITAVDLYFCLINPFSDVKRNVKRYYGIVFLIAISMSILIVFQPNLHGFAEGNFCWTNVIQLNAMKQSFFRINVANWMLFYSFMGFIYIYSIGVLAFGFSRLRQGLEATLHSRKQMLRSSAISVVFYTLYWTLVLFLYSLSYQPGAIWNRQKDKENLTLGLFSYFLSGRGFIDYAVWFFINDPVHLSRKNWGKKTGQRSADLDVSVQFNEALQKEILTYTTKGMAQAIENAHRLYEKLLSELQLQKILENKNTTPTSQENKNTTPTSLENKNTTTTSLENKNTTTTSLENKNTTPTSQKPPHQIDDLNWKQEENNSNDEMIRKRLLLASMNRHSQARIIANQSTKKILFTDYESMSFTEIRRAVGVTPDDFFRSFETTTKPIISEGASGAFMFFSGDRSFIVKSTTKQESEFLRNSIVAYASYLCSNLDSFITRFLGCFKVQLYQQDFYFIVMENLFDVGKEIEIHHRFDIKGSWVNRRYKKPREGTKTKCRHCRMEFSFGEKNSCPNVVGRHEPNVVLKDDDMVTRIRIGEQEGVALYQQLVQDSQFLCSLGIMDYSLLLGVVDVEYHVKDAQARARGGIGSLPSRSSSSSMNSISFADVSQNNGKRNMIKQANVGLRESDVVVGPGFYYVGIIDILQTWNWDKKIERFIKVYLLGKNGDGLSAINPIAYRDRFQKKLREIIHLPPPSQSDSDSNSSDIQQNEKVVSEPIIVRSLRSRDRYDSLNMTMHHNNTTADSI